MESQNYLDKAKEALRTQTRYHDFKSYGSSFSVLDDKENLLYFKHLEALIVIILGAKDKNLAEEISTDIKFK